ncbi:hypothetical protein HanRHA438_Chr01g0020911 [Helianthus annuus]|nr:hypothetical protein HanRHA438_Chr01g0020911 [Helianthus annuus]
MRGENKRNEMRSRRAPFSGDESAVGSGALMAAMMVNNVVIDIYDGWKMIGGGGGHCCY